MIKFFNKLSALVVCALISVSAHCQAMNLFRDFVAPFDNMMISTGFYLNTYDLYTAPLKTHKDLMGLKGDVKKMTQVVTINNYDDNISFTKGIHIDTVYFNPSGNVTKFNYFVNSEAVLAFAPESVEVFYDENGRLKSMYKYSIVQVYNDMVNRIDETRFVYSNDGKLQNEIYNMYNEKDGKREMVESFRDQVEATYLYDAQGVLSVAKRNMLNGELMYNEDGMLSDIVSEGVKSNTYKYYDDDRLMSAMILDTEPSMDDIDDLRYRYDISFTRNDKGDVTRVVKTKSRCNKYWRISKKGLPKTYVINYVYDSYGNWTKATLTKGKINLLTITRSFVY